MLPLLLAVGLLVACGDDGAAESDASDSTGSAASSGDGDDGTNDDGEATAGGDTAEPTDDSADDTTAENGSDDDGGDTADGDEEAADDGDEGAADERGDDDASADDGVIEGTVVSAEDGAPLAGAVLTVGDRSATSDDDGRFRVEAAGDEAVLVRLPTWLPVSRPADELGTTDDGEVVIELTPVLARGVRVSREVAADRQRFEDLLDLVAPTTVNALVFDTKDETGNVLYATEVAKADELEAVVVTYRPDELLARAIEEGLYPITRVVTFEDTIWAGADAEAKLAGAWVDATDEANWEYPLGLAEEACRLGFAEIQFDYVRYPAGRTAEIAASQVPSTSGERAAVISAFLTEAGERLSPLGCGVSAAIFGIVMSSETDEGIGQTVEDIGPVVDALSPMLYPSHYGPGWLGFADPNDHPGPVIADALDDGLPKLTTETQMRPWIQAFYYNGAQIGAQITEAEARGAGWLLWNASGNYREDWLPAGP